MLLHKQNIVCHSRETTNKKTSYFLKWAKKKSEIIYTRKKFGHLDNVIPYLGQKWILKR